MARAFTTTLACAELSLAPLVASATPADEDFAHKAAPTQSSSPDLLVHPILGLGLGLSDSGRHVGAHLGLRVRPAVIRLSLQANDLVYLVTAHRPGRAFDLVAAHADWVFAVSKHLAGFAGLGCGFLRYGYFFDSPVHRTTALLPEVGLILGPLASGAGRLILNAAIVIPTTSPSGRYFSPVDQIDSPRFMLSLVFSV